MIKHRYRFDETSKALLNKHTFSHHGRYHIQTKAGHQTTSWQFCRSELAMLWFLDTVLGKDTERMTLEAIGKKYNITRERVRQIENHAINQSENQRSIRKKKKLLTNSNMSPHSRWP
jgi:hypothetical protein